MSKRFWKKHLNNLKLKLWSTRNLSQFQHKELISRLDSEDKKLAKTSAEMRTLKQEASNHSGQIERLGLDISSNFNNLESVILDNRLKQAKLQRCGESFSKHDGAKKQVLLVGYYGAQNYGDELMLSILYDALTKKDDIELSIILTDNDDYDRSQWDRAHLYGFPEDNNQLEKIAGFYDEVILGGGAHIDDTDLKSLDFTPYFIIELSHLMIDRGKDVRWIAVSSNKVLSRKKYIGDLQLIIDGTRYFSLRDSNSLETLKAAGLNVSKVEVTEDIAFAYDMSIKTVGITLINFFDDIETLARFCDDVVSFIKSQKEKWQICLLPFFNHHHNDIVIYEELVARVNWKGVRVFIGPEYANVDITPTFIKSFDLMINMRYHASLLSLSAGIPTVSICYDVHPHYFNKITYLHKEFHDPNLVFYTKYSSEKIALASINAIRAGRETRRPINVSPNLVSRSIKDSI